MKPLVLVFADDPGGANALRPVIKRLRCDQRVELTVAASPDAAAVLAPVLADELADGDWPSLPLGAALIVTGTSGYRTGERRLREKAAAAGVPRIAIVDYWNNYLARFDDDERRSPGLHVAVLDEDMRADMAGSGVPERALTVTGHPAHDALLAHRAWVHSRPGEPPRILFVSQPWRDLTGDDRAHPLHPGFDEVEVLEMTARAASEAAGGRPVVLAVRRHPRERRPSILPPVPANIELALDETPSALDALVAADVVIGMNAALLVDACILGLPTVSLQPGLRLPDPLPTNRGGHSVALYDAEDLAPTIEALIHDGPRRRAQQQAALGFPVRQDATGRFTALVYEVLST